MLLLAELRKALKKMDIQVEVFITDEEFLRTYFIDRRIHDFLGGGF
jgi:intergrase/recombinase